MHEFTSKDFSIWDTGMYIIALWWREHYRHFNPEGLEPRYIEHLHKFLTCPLASELNVKEAKCVLLEEKRKSTKQKRIASRRNKLSNHRREIMQSLIARDGEFCQECGTNKRLSIDHIIPITRDGSDELDNLCLLCFSCNSSKGQKFGKQDNKATNDE